MGRIKSTTKSELQVFEDSFIPEPNSGCWLWIGPIFKHRGGYGCFNYGKKIMQRAHRISWKLYKHDINSKDHVLHHCDNPLCVNPDHLFLGDQNINMIDKSFKGRQLEAEANPAFKHGKYIGDKKNPIYPTGIVSR